MSVNFNEIEENMKKAIKALERAFAALRTGRASPSMLDTVTVDAYGAKMPLSQVGTVNVPEPRMLTVQVYDVSNVKAVEKAIRESGLGLNPQLDGQLVRIPIPDLTQERRKELSRVAAKEAETARISIRNERQSGNNKVKQLEKENILSEDAGKDAHNKIQDLTDKYIKVVDDLLAAKDQDIRTV